MRHLTAVLVLSLFVSTAPAAFAADAPAPASTGAAPAGDAPAPFAEPNLKLPKDSGGISTSPMVVDAPLPEDHVMGKATAPVTMIEYASLSCPHCGHFSSTVMPTLQKDYIDTGKMRYILRQFPLNEPALKGAMLLDCVGEENNDKYFVFAKVLFDAQTKWAFDSNYMAGLETIASVGGLSKDQFQRCTNSTDREVKVLRAKKAAEDGIKIPHTPYIFINNEVYEGERTPEAMAKFIDKKMAEAPAKKTP